MFVINIIVFRRRSDSPVYPTEVFEKNDKGKGSSPLSLKVCSSNPVAWASPASLLER